MSRDRTEERRRIMDEMDQPLVAGSFLPFKPGTPLWKEGKGNHLVEILEYEVGRFDPSCRPGGSKREGDLAYVMPLFVHQNAGVQEGMRICLSLSYGKKCPGCEERARLQNEGADENKIKVWTPSRYPRVLYKIICLDSTEEKRKGVQIFHTSYYLFEMYLREAAKRVVRPGSERKIDPYIPFWDLKEGRSIAWKTEGEGTSKKDIGVRLEERDYDIDPKLDTLAPIDELIIIPTYDELEEFFFGDTKGSRGGYRTGERGAGRDEEDDRRRRPEEDDRDRDRDRRSEEAGDRERREPSDRARGEGGDRARGEGQTPKCPEGYKFGVDIDEYKACKRCDEWKACARDAADRKTTARDSEGAGHRRSEGDDRGHKESESSREGEHRRSEEDDPPPRRRRQAEDNPPDSSPDESRRRRQAEDVDNRGSDPEPETRRRRRE